jgi:outer membrane protein TolC
MTVWRSTLFPRVLLSIWVATVYPTSVSLAADVALQVQASPATQAPPQGKLLNIEDAVRIGLENHPRIRAARERVGSQEAILGQQMSAYYPTINFNNSYRTTNASGTSGTSSSATDTYTSQANLNLTLYNFGKREGTVQAARETVDATREDFSTTTQDIALSVKQAYYTYLGTQALVRVRQETLRNRELLVRQAQGFYEVGTRARIDVARAEANLYTARADLIGAENSVKIAWVTLRNAM